MKYSNSPAIAEWLIYFSDGFMCNSMREHSLAYTDTKRTGVNSATIMTRSISNVTLVTMSVTPFFLAALDKRPNLLFSSSMHQCINPPAFDIQALPYDPFLLSFDSPAHPAIVEI